MPKERIILTVVFDYKEVYQNAMTTPEWAEIVFALPKEIIPNTVNAGWVRIEKTKIE